VFCTIIIVGSRGIEEEGLESADLPLCMQIGLITENIIIRVTKD